MGKTNKKNVSQRQMNLEKSKELLKELLPLIKAFGLWIVLVVIVAFHNVSIARVGKNDVHSIADNRIGTKHGYNT